MQSIRLPDNEFISSYSVCGIYQVTHKLGEGSDGEVLRAFNINTGVEVAIKTTPRFNREEYFTPAMKYEALVHSLVPHDTEGFPTIHYAGPDANHYVIVMERLGPNLADLLRVCRGTFTLMRTICMLADQMLNRLEFLHSRGVVHCDVKTHNFAVGLGDKADIVYMFDFTYARPYLLPDMSGHIPFSSSGRHAIGTVRYASVAAHKSHSVSRADDLESLLYVLLEFYHGTLPWQGLPAPNSSIKRKIVYEMKTDPKIPVSIYSLLGRSPPEFRQFYVHLMSLEYGGEPDYTYLRDLFRDWMEREGPGYTYNWKYDWMDASRLAKGTLLPEEYVVNKDFVEETMFNPYVM